MRRRAVSSIALLVLLFGALGVPCLAISRAQAQAPAAHAGHCQPPDAAATQILCAAPTLLASLPAGVERLPEPDQLAASPIATLAPADVEVVPALVAARRHAPRATAPPHYLLHSAFLI